MAFYLPNFNLSASWWKFGDTPADDFPTETEIPCQVYRLAKQPSVQSIATLRIPIEYSFLEFPATFGVLSNPIVECPEGSGTYYRIQGCVWMHRGFPNEYLAMRGDPCLDNGVTIASDTDLL